MDDRQSLIMSVELFKTAAEIREYLRDKQVAFIPTMGSLHAGHQSLIGAADGLNMTTVVSIFVNPTQFNVPADFENYPRDLGDDIVKAKGAGCDIVFAPDAEEIYPPGDSTTVVVSGLTESYEGTHRPGHFEGVATVVTKLFLIVQPNVVIFGEKDWQQCLAIRRLIRDLHLPVELKICRTLREEDGLAMSSRNVRLTPKQRQVAPLLYNCMQSAAEAFRNFINTDDIEQQSTRLLQEAGFEVDYFAIVDSDTLGFPSGSESRVITAAKLGDVRLIDNLLI